MTGACALQRAFDAQADAWPVAATDPGGEMLQLLQDMRRLRQRALQAEVIRLSSGLAAGSYPAAEEGGEGSEGSEGSTARVEL